MCRCVAEALRCLHEAGWGHGDVRWANVIWVAPGHYCLIDLESVVLLESEPEGPFPHAWGSNGEALEGGKFTPRSDLYMLGKMLQQTGIEADDPIGDLASQLTSKSLNVEDVLQHPCMQ
eukprot:GHUV01017559.1.p1 GENE.GHUV01017559.1~~GHUV01017559.1.p1  ORF type:complete len:119 (+),score=32.90 GHUV01017559.1:377-733(+)